MSGSILQVQPRSTFDILLTRRLSTSPRFEWVSKRKKGQGQNKRFPDCCRATCQLFRSS